MRISVITVVKDGADTIADNFESVLAQTHRDIEHIVIDGASTDDTMRVVERYADRLAVVVSEPDDGLYDAMNKGIALATGEIIATLNADDVYADPTVLETVAKEFEDPDVEATFGNLVYVDRNNIDRVVRYWESQPYKLGLFERGWIPAHPTFFVRANVYERFGAFNTDYKIQSDFDLCLRFLRVHRIRSRFIPMIMVRMRMGGVSNRSLGSILAGNLESFRSCRAHGLRVNPVTFFAKKWLSRLPQFFRRPTDIRANSGASQ